MDQLQYTIATAVEQIEKCAFECEGGPLTNNTGWRWLKEHLSSGPKFALDQPVLFNVEAEVAGVKIAQPVKMWVVGIAMASDPERLTWRYALSTDPPRPYHYGSGVQFNGVAENKLSDAAS